MDIAEIFGKVAGIIAVIAFIPYIYSVLKGKTRPNRASWLIWSVLGGCLLASYYYSGATTTIWIPLIYAIAPVVIFLLSLKYGVGGYELLDMICLTGAAVGLLVWRISESAELALYLNIMIDALGFIPTIKKAWLTPKSESKAAWIIGASATLLNLPAITSWEPQIALYPLYLAVFNSLIAVLVLGILQQKLKWGNKL